MTSGRTGASIFTADQGSRNRSAGPLVRTGPPVVRPGRVRTVSGSPAPDR